MSKYKYFFVSVFFISFTLSGVAQHTIKSVTPNTLSAIINNNNIQLLDVRTPNEFKSGHIKGAVNINYYDQNFSTQVLKINKNRPVYVYCRSGVRSRYSSEILKKLGFKSIYNLKGGVLNWSSQKLPLVK